MYMPGQIIFALANNAPFKIGSDIFSPESYPKGGDTCLVYTRASGGICTPASIEEAEKLLRSGRIAVPVYGGRDIRRTCVCCDEDKHAPNEQCGGTVQSAIDRYNAVIEKYGERAVKYKERLLDHLEQEKALQADNATLP